MSAEGGHEVRTVKTRATRSERVRMNVQPDVRERLQQLLLHDDHLRGVGYSDFLRAALDAYEVGLWAP